MKRLKPCDMIGQHVNLIPMVMIATHEVVKVDLLSRSTQIPVTLHLDLQTTFLYQSLLNLFIPKLFKIIYFFAP